MKYKLINSVSKKETICDKVVVDGWDYYVSDEKPTGYCLVNGGLGRIGIDLIQEKVEYSISPKKVIATNNPSIDLPKVVDEVDRYRNKYFETTSFGSVNPIGYYKAYESGYNKSQETHPFSEEDMIEFEKFCTHTDYKNGFGRVDRKELLQLWKEQQPKIVWYE